MTATACRYPHAAVSTRTSALAPAAERAGGGGAAALPLPTSLFDRRRRRSGGVPLALPRRAVGEGPSVPGDCPSPGHRQVSTRVGALQSCGSSCPHCPLPPLPKAYSAPVAAHTRVKSHPHATPTTCSAARQRTGHGGSQSRAKRGKGEGPHRRGRSLAWAPGGSPASRGPACRSGPGPRTTRTRPLRGSVGDQSGRDTAPAAPTHPSRRPCARRRS